MRRKSGRQTQDAVAEAARGAALAREGKYDLAIEHYKAALRLDPHLPGLHLNLGLAYFKSNHLPEAAAAFEEAVRADSGNFQARALLGMSYYGSGRYRDAAAQLKLASEAQPDNLELRYTLAQSYLWSEQYPEALREFQFLLSKDPDSAPVHILLGQALDASNRTEAATAEFEAAVKASTVPPNAHFGLGYLYWKQQRYEEACREFEAELANQPQHAQALTYLGDVEMHTEQDEAGRNAPSTRAGVGCRTCGSPIWIWASFSPQGTIPTKPPAISARRSGSTLPSPMRITGWAGCGVPWAASRRRRPSSTR